MTCLNCIKLLSAARVMFELNLWPFACQVNMLTTKLKIFIFPIGKLQTSSSSAGRQGGRTGKVCAMDGNSLLLRAIPQIKTNQSLLVSVSRLPKTQPFSSTQRRWVAHHTTKSSSSNPPSPISCSKPGKPDLWRPLTQYRQLIKPGLFQVRLECSCCNDVNNSRRYNTVRQLFCKLLFCHCFECGCCSPSGEIGKSLTLRRQFPITEIARNYIKLVFTQQCWKPSCPYFGLSSRVIQ